MAVNQRTLGILIDRGVLEDFLVLDATTQSDHRLQAEVTSNPIESNNGNVTDHRRIKPKAWGFTAILVDEADPSAPGNRSSAATDFGFNSLESARLNGPQVQPNAQTSLQFLREIFESSDVVSVTTEVETIDNAVLENLSYKVITSNLLNNGFQAEPSVIEVSGSFREVRFATTEIVAVPVDAVAQSQGKKQNVGTATPQPASTETTDKGRSTLSNGFGDSIVPPG